MVINNALIMLVGVFAGVLNVAHWWRLRYVRQQRKLERSIARAMRAQAEVSEAEAIDGLTELWVLCETQRLTGRCDENAIVITFPDGNEMMVGSN